MGLIYDARCAIRDLLFETPTSGLGRRIIETVILFLIFGNLLALYFEHNEAFVAEHGDALHLFDRISVAVFTVELLLRNLAASTMPGQAGLKGWLRYLITPSNLIDMVAVLPFYLTAFVQIDLRYLRALRFLRLLKLAKYLRPIVAYWRASYGKPIRQRVYGLLYEADGSEHAHSVIDRFLIIVIFLSVIAVVLETVPYLHELLAPEFQVIDSFSVVVFSLELIGRLYVAPEHPDFSQRKHPRFAYLTSLPAMVDIAAVLPFYLSHFVHFDLRFLRVMRLLRILKLTRYSNAMVLLLAVLKREWQSFVASGFLVVLIVIFAASLAYLVEHEAQPEKFASIPMAMYWACITLLGVGYGDITPVTSLGQILTSVMAMMGIALVALPAGILATGFQEYLREQRDDFAKLVAKSLSDGEIDDHERAVLEDKRFAMGISANDAARIEEQAINERLKINSAAVKGQPPARTPVAGEPLSLALSDALASLPHLYGDRTQLLLIPALPNGMVPKELALVAAGDARRLVVFTEADGPVGPQTIGDIEVEVVSLARLSELLKSAIKLQGGIVATEPDRGELIRQGAFA